MEGHKSKKAKTTRRSPVETCPDVDAIAADIVHLNDINEDPNGDSSKRQDQSALKQFLKFMTAIGTQVDSLEEIPSALVSKELIGRFCTFLLRSNTIGYQTSMNYLSCIRRQLERSHGTTMFNDNPSWYSDTRQNLMKQYVLTCVRGRFAIKQITIILNNIQSRRDKIEGACTPYDDARSCNNWTASISATKC